MLNHFLISHDYFALKERIQKIKMNTVEAKVKFPFVYEIS